MKKNNNNNLILANLNLKTVITSDYICHNTIFNNFNGIFMLAANADEKNEKCCSHRQHLYCIQ